MAPKKTEKPHSVRLPADYTEKIAALVERFKVTKSMVFRMGIDALSESVQKPSEVKLEGSKGIRDKKWIIIDELLKGKGPCMAARTAETTRRTLKHWMTTDPLFAELAHDARDESVEMVEHVVWHKAANEKNLNACYGVLNARHEQYGLVKSGYVEAQLKKLIEGRVIPAVQRYLSRDDMESLGLELRAIIDGSSLPSARGG